jgi:hypothetical protein
MLESVYEACLCHGLERTGIAVERQVGIPVVYKSVRLDEGFRADIERLRAASWFLVCFVLNACSKTAWSRPAVR